MKPYVQVLQRILNAMAFANVGNQREFEELLATGDRRLLREKRNTARHYGAAARRTRRQPTAFAFPLNEAVPR
ncbi:MAG: hypothetical protein PHY45_10430 [Rhodocyclaceae bacterium]|nr:hypothetical protein [Rhodocyclaceae bacterium]